MENPSGEKSDGLEIISIGALYKGSWDKKFWSSSRGRDRYPYPIGYHALRTHIGITYEMEIHEGLKGPLFVITSTDGESCTGQTPDIVWECFQKKGGPRVKMGNGKRFSCKIDGVEFFGFRNPLVQRLLRELVANVNGTAERSLLSPGLYDGASGLEPKTRPPDPCTNTDLLPYLVKLQSTRKRSRKHKITSINAISGTGHKRLQTQDLSNDAEVATTKKGYRRNHNDKKWLTSSASDEDCQAHKDPEAWPVPVKEHKLVDSEDSRFTCFTNELSEQEKLYDRSLGADMQGCNSLMAIEDRSKEISSLTESKSIKNLDLCAPDTLNHLQESYKGSLCHVKDELAAADTTVSGGLAMDLHLEELGTSTSNASSAKSDFDSVGQELAKSMMTLLLPQALPLLQKTSSKKRAAIRSSEILTNGDPCLNLAGVKFPEENEEMYHLAEVISPGKLEVGMPVEGSQVEMEGKMYNLDTFLGSDILNSEDVKSVVPDSFEDDQFGYHVTKGRPLCSGFVEADQAPFDKKECNHDTFGLLGCVDGSKESSNFHGETSGNNEIFYDELPIFLDEKPEKDEILISDSPLGCISPNERIVLEGEPKDICVNLDGKSLCLETHSRVDNFTDKNLESVSDCIKDIPALEPTFLMHSHAQSFHGENISKSELPNLGPADETPDSPTSFRNKETAFSPKMVALSLETAYLKQALPPFSSTKNFETMSSEIPKAKLVQYHHRHCSTDQKFQSTDIHWDQDNPNTQRNQDNMGTHGLLAIIDARDANLMGSVSSVHISQKEVDAETGATRTGKDSSFIQIPDLVPSTTKYNGPLSESIICRNTREGCVTETYPITESLFATEIGQASASGNSLNREMSFMSEVKIDGQHHGFNMEKGILIPKGMISNVASSVSQTQPPVSEVKLDGQHHGFNMEEGIFRPKGMISNMSSSVSQTQAVVVHATKDKDSSFVDPSISDVERHQVDAVKELLGPHNLTDCSRSLSWFQEREKSFFDNNGHDPKDILADLDLQPHMKSVTGRDCRNLVSHDKLGEECFLQDPCFTLEMVHNKESEGLVELVGCYGHPTPVLSILLSTQGDDVHISVLCGLLADKDRTLFIYKVPIKEPRGGCPSFIGYTSIVLPISKSTFCTEIAYERSGLQFTPDGQYLVFPNSVKAPSCREQSIHCLCSLCKSDWFEENAVKVVHVKLGYVSLVVKLKTAESVHCILVCEPSHLVAVEESGRLHVWVMNSMWSAWVDEFILPSFDYISPRTVELKRIPKCASLIVGHNSFGGFGLWDISKRVLLSRFSAPGISVFQILPVGLFSWQRKGPVPASPDVEEHIKEIMAATEMWFSGPSEDHASLPNREDIAVWLLVSAAGDSEAQHDHQANGTNTCPAGCWRLALLVKNMVILGTALDPRTSAIDASLGRGIIGTHDGLVYMWELSTGMKLADLHYFRGGSVSCIAADSRSGVFAVAGDDCQLMVYATLSKGREINEPIS